MKEKRLESYLEENEEIVWSGKPKENDYLSVKTLAVAPVIFIWLVIECLILGYVIANKIIDKAFNTYYVVMMVAAVLLHIVPTAIWFFGVVGENASVNEQEYAVTSKNIIVMHGSKHHHVEIIPLSEAEDVFVKRNLAQRIMGTGTVYIETEEEKINFHSQEDCVKVFRRVYKAVKREDLNAQVPQNAGNSAVFTQDEAGEDE